MTSNRLHWYGLVSINYMWHWIAWWLTKFKSTIIKQKGGGKGPGAGSVGLSHLQKILMSPRAQLSLAFKDTSVPLYVCRFELSDLSSLVRTAQPTPVAPVSASLPPSQHPVKTLNCMSTIPSFLIQLYYHFLIPLRKLIRKMAKDRHKDHLESRTAEPPRESERRDMVQLMVLNLFPDLLSMEVYFSTLGCRKSESTLLFLRQNAENLPSAHFPWEWMYFWNIASFTHIWLVHSFLLSPVGILSMQMMSLYFMTNTSLRRSNDASARLGRPVLFNTNFVKNVKTGELYVVFLVAWNTGSISEVFHLVSFLSAAGTEPRHIIINCILSPF